MPSNRETISQQSYHFSHCFFSINIYAPFPHSLSSSLDIFILHIIQYDHHSWLYTIDNLGLSPIYCSQQSLCLRLERQIIPDQYQLSEDTSQINQGHQSSILIKESKACFSCSVTKLHLTLCSPMDYSMPGIPVFLCLPECGHTHVHWVGDSIQPSYPLLPPSSFAFNLRTQMRIQKCSLSQIEQVCDIQFRVDGHREEFLRVLNKQSSDESTEVSYCPKIESEQLSSQLLG